MSSIINPFVFGAGATGGPDGTEYYATITVQATEVDATLTNFPVYVSLASMPAGFWTAVQSDGGDIRVTENDGATRAPVDLVSISTGTSTGELHFLASSLSASTNTVYRVYYGKTGGGLSQPAVGDTYGRNAVWADYAGVWHMHEDPTGGSGAIIDSTGNGNNGTAQGSMTSGDSVAGKLAGQALDFDGSNDWISTGTLGTFGSTAFGTAFAIGAWLKTTSSAQGAVAGNFNDGLNTGFYFYANRVRTTGANGSASSGKLMAYLREDGGDNSLGFSQSAVNINDGNWNHLVMTYATNRLVVNGVARALSSGTFLSGFNGNTSDFGYPLGIGGSNNRGTLADPLAGQLDEVRVRKDSASEAFFAAEYSNQNTPATFYAVGTQQAA